MPQATCWGSRGAPALWVLAPIPQLRARPWLPGAGRKQCGILGRVWVWTLAAFIIWSLPRQSVQVSLVNGADGDDPTGSLGLERDVGKPSLHKRPVSTGPSPWPGWGLPVLGEGLGLGGPQSSRAGGQDRRGPWVVLPALTSLLTLQGQHGPRDLCGGCPGGGGHGWQQMLCWGPCG